MQILCDPHPLLQAKLEPYKGRTSTDKEICQEQTISDPRKGPLGTEIPGEDHQEETLREETQLKEDHQEETHHAEAHQLKGIRTTMNKGIESILERSAAISTSSTEIEQRPRNSKWNLAWPR